MRYRLSRIIAQFLCLGALVLPAYGPLGASAATAVTGRHTSLTVSAAADLSGCLSAERRTAPKRWADWHVCINAEKSAAAVGTDIQIVAETNGKRKSTNELDILNATTGEPVAACGPPPQPARWICRGTESQTSPGIHTYYAVVTSGSKSKRAGPATVRWGKPDTITVWASQTEQWQLLPITIKIESFVLSDSPWKTIMFSETGPWDPSGPNPCRVNKVCEYTLVGDGQKTGGQYLVSARDQDLKDIPGTDQVFDLTWKPWPVSLTATPGGEVAPGTSVTLKASLKIQVPEGAPGNAALGIYSVDTGEKICSAPVSQLDCTARVTSAEEATRRYKVLISSDAEGTAGALTTAPNLTVSWKKSLLPHRYTFADASIVWVQVDTRCMELVGYPRECTTFPGDKIENTIRGEVCGDMYETPWVVTIHRAWVHRGSGEYLNDLPWVRLSFDRESRTATTGIDVLSKYLFFSMDLWKPAAKIVIAPDATSINITALVIRPPDTEEKSPYGTEQWHHDIDPESGIVTAVVPIHDEGTCEQK